MLKVCVHMSTWLHEARWRHGLMRVPGRRGRCRTHPCTSIRSTVGDIPVETIRCCSDSSCGDRRLTVTVTEKWSCTWDGLIH